MPIRILAAVLTIALLASGAKADEPAAVDALKKLGASVSSARGGGWNVEFRNASDLSDAAWKELETLPDIKHFSTGGKEFDDAALAKLTRLKSLQSIFFNGPTFTDQGLTVLRQLPDLQELSMDHCQTLTGVGVAALQGSGRLTSVGFGGCTVSDEGVEAICRLDQLQALRLGHERNTRRSFPAIVALPNLRRLQITSNWDPAAYDARDLKTLSACPKLEELEIHDMLLPWKDGLEYVPQFKSLKVLKLYWSAPDADAIEKLKAAMPMLHLDVDHPADSQRVEDARRRLKDYEASQAK